ncbi:GNAT family N-acetyltransferase [Streptomyces sp. NBC_00211]|uniref:GNAT family N-acetyltransferase n=1 Tax=Streptomyces sp. NBC_00211 TaxID=2975683 RepID=UPI0038677221
MLAGSGDPAPFGAYEIRRRADGLTIGGAGFHGPADAAGVVTVGYGLVPAARGRGHPAEALRALPGRTGRAGRRATPTGRTPPRTGSWPRPGCGSSGRTVGRGTTR